MPQNQTDPDVQKRIEQYSRQLLDAYRQRTENPTPLTPSPPSPLPTTPTVDAAWLEENFPLPNVERDRAAIAVAAPQPSSEPSTPSPDTEQTPDGEAPNIGESPYVGYLRVFVFTGQTAEPLQDASVTVTRRQGEQEILFASAVTDGDGFTPVIPLPSVDPLLTMQPGSVAPYVAYDIRVSVPGFQTTLYENVPVYGNNYVTQSAAMLPLIPGQDPDAVRIFRSGAPTNL